MPRGLRAYELMVIIDGDEEDATVDAVVQRITTQVGADGGTVPTIDKWGKKRFAYEINHKHEGHYVVLEIVAPVPLDEVERQLRLADEVVRHKLIRLPEGEADRRGLFGGGDEAPAA